MTVSDTVGGVWSVLRSFGWPVTVTFSQSAAKVGAEEPSRTMKPESFAWFVTVSNWMSSVELPSFAFYVML